MFRGNEETPETSQMKRRHILAGAAAIGLCRPAIGGTAKTLIHVPQANLTSLDPVWTTALVTRNSAGMIFETLFGRDEQLSPKPQMLEGFTHRGRLACAGP